MSRDRSRDEDDDRDAPPPRRQSTSPVLVFALVLGGLLVVSVVACGAFGLFWTRAVVQEQQDAEAEAVADAKAGTVKAVKGMTRVYTRHEFRDLVMGKTPDEVIAAVGKPDEATEDGDVIRWTYGGRVRGPGPGQPAATPVVVFRDGKAAEVQY